MTDLNEILLAIARKHHLREAWQILVDGGFSDAEADRLIAKADRQINDYIKHWAESIRRSKGA